MSYQPEERYWTDYLRIALPVVGLLLMLGLFWFWAASLIGDDDDNNTPEATVVAQNEPTAVPTTPVTTTNPEATQPSDGQASGGNPTEAPEETQPAEDNTGDQNNDEDTPPATEESSEGNGEAQCDADFCEGDLVTVNSDEVNLREEPSTDATSLAVLSEGTQFDVTGAPEEAGDLTWIPVSGDVDGEQLDGYIASDYLTKEES